MSTLFGFLFVIFLPVQSLQALEPSNQLALSGIVNQEFLDDPTFVNLSRVKLKLINLSATLPNFDNSWLKISLIDRNSQELFL